MSILQNQLFFLPIHRHSYDKYYREHERWIKPRKKEIERQWNKKFNELDPKIQFQWKESWFWPPWKFNDIVGFLDIGMDGANSLTANVYLKRKHFPKSARERQNRYHSSLKNQEYLFYCEVKKIKVDIDDNQSFLHGIKELLNEAEKIIKNLNRNFKLWSNFNLDCFNFAKAYKKRRIDKRNST